MAKLWTYRVTSELVASDGGSITCTCWVGYAAPTKSIGGNAEARVVVTAGADAAMLLELHAGIVAEINPDLQYMHPGFTGFTVGDLWTAPWRKSAT